MGKPFAQELERLSEVYDWATKTPIDELSKFIKKSAKTPLYVIGSGGSFSATTFASILHQETGTIAKCLTPLEFLEYENIDSNCSILIITAGGNNVDILSSFDKTIKLKPKNLGILCASENNKLTRKASGMTNIAIHAVTLPTRKDGFLATNSLIAMLIWLFRAYAETYSLPFEIPRLNQLVFQGKSTSQFYEDLIKKLEEFHDKKTIVLLYDNWSKIAAIDAESKLVEAGLINVQLADYRNFAHGRHNWLDKNKEQTGLLALITPQCEQLATKTLKLIPEYIPTAILTTNYDGPVATISLLIQVFYMVHFFGTLRGIDPGKPGVADFGSKIYHLSMTKNGTNFITDFEKLPLRRKFGNISLSTKTKTELQALHRFVDTISDEQFHGVVFDYDGTLCDREHRFTHPSNEIGKMLTMLLQNNIMVGVATGRGKSVRESLQKVIPKKFQSKLYLGYYNCSDIASLDKNHSPNITLPTDPDLLAFLEFLENSDIISKNEKIRKRPYQISLESGNLCASTLIDSVERIDKQKLEKIRIVESSHSIDLISKHVSKLNLVNYMRENGLGDNSVLCVGDRGKWPGNDFELLKTKFSLSVNEVSDDLNSCWNLVPSGHYGELATLDYFKNIELNNGYFKLDFRNLGLKHE